MGQYVTFDVSQLTELAEKLKAAGHGDFKQELALWVDAIGNEFLDIVVQQIIAREATDTRNLLSSFTKGGNGNVWTSSDGGLRLEVGTEVEYAKWVNDGHGKHYWEAAIRTMEAMLPNYVEAKMNQWLTRYFGV